MNQEDGEKFMKTINGAPGPGTRAVPDDQFDDSYDQIKQQ